ncbi:unnamed protein product [Discula destructiva]
MRRQSALLASRRIQTQIGSDEETATTKARPPPPARVASKRESGADAYEEAAAPQPPARPAKRIKTGRKTATAAASDLHHRLFTTTPATAAASSPHAHAHGTTATCHFPLREHAVDYHRPLLLHDELGKRGRSALLSWYDGVNTKRAMPWRKPFIDPADYQDKAQLRQALTQRAYEVFISEIMLQQTRVATVIDYWNRWMARWPTIYDLAQADEDEVMSAWRGLGYYSRCRRILEACRMVVQHAEWDGLMPQDAKDLEAHIPGVGPYTAGAISCIVFGRAAPMVDGNVLRVLSRQLGVLGDTKTDKTVIDLIWAAARCLVAAVAAEATVDGEDGGNGEIKPNNGPGRWGQALMELGSTICTPNPDCSACPITMTCRAYQEGTILARGGTRPSREPTEHSAKTVDIEDACQLCAPFLDVAAAEEPTKPATTAKKPKQATLSSLFAAKSAAAARRQAGKKDQQDALSPEALKTITSHAQRFPVKAVKKALREQETLVCAIRRASDGMYLLQKRPEKGLLAGMWEFPSDILPDSNNSTAAARKTRARDLVNGLFAPDGCSADMEYAGELGSVPWVFSHLKLTMHVHVFELTSPDEVPLAGTGPHRRRWASATAVEAETMGTGMRQCWRLVAESA